MEWQLKSPLSNDWGGQLKIDGLVNSSLGRTLKKFWFSGWAMDLLYDRLLVRPYKGLAYMLRGEWVDVIYNSIVKVCQMLFVGLSHTQTGRLRWYATSMVFGVIVVIALLLGVI